MSHFTVLVIGDNIEEQLAPYQENNMGDCPREYLEFNDQEDEFLSEYKVEGVEMLRLPDGELGYSWDNKDIEDSCPKEYINHRDRFKTFEEFVNEWHGNPRRDREKQRFGYWENPRAKWDGYRIGGRWDGFFLLKNGRRADQALKKDIDFVKMSEEYLGKRLQRYELFQKTLAGRELPDWGKIRDEYLDNISEAKEIYRGHPVIQDLDKLENYPFFCDDLKQYSVPREDFIKLNNLNTTFAIVKDKKWYERGSMGWWAIVTDEKDQHSWQETYRDILDKTSDDELLTLVDCHI